mgnify:CR=1 FL=1
MSEAIRLNKVAKELGVGVKTITDFLNEKGVDCDGRPTSKIDGASHDMLLDNFSSDKKTKEKSESLNAQREERITISLEDQVREKPSRVDDFEDEVVIKNVSVKPVVDLPSAPKEEKTPEIKEVPIEKTEGKSDAPNVVGKIDLASLNLKTRPDKKKKEKPATKPKEEAKVEKPVPETNKPKPVKTPKPGPKPPVLQEKKPNIPLITVKSLDEGFEKLRDKTLDVFIVNAATARYFINKKGYEELKIATKIEFNLELKIALQKKIFLQFNTC